MRNVELVNGEYYHIYNRAVDKRLIFGADNDYWRFVQGLYVFNNENFVNNPFVPDFLRIVNNIKGTRRPLVDIIAWCIMPNHYHLLVRQIVEGGISKFIQKHANSFTKYFNKKHDRSGHLFESVYKAKLVEDETYFTHLSRYIHLNHLELCEPDWKENGIADIERAKKFLVEYPWSSYRDYAGERPSIFLPIINREPINEVFDRDLNKYKDFICDLTMAREFEDELLVTPGVV